MKQKAIIFFVILLQPLISYATPYGFSYTHALIGSIPDHLNGYRAAIFYQPPYLNWPNAQIYFDTAYGHWWVNSNTTHLNLSIYSIAPYIRHYLIKQNSFSPYVEASIGLSYLTKTYLDDRNLGTHFSFQDQLGIGTAFGPQQNLYLTLHIMHYSNASLCNHNSGITAPLTLTLGYRF